MTGVWTVESAMDSFFLTLPNFYLYVLFTIIYEGLSEKRQQKTEAEGKK